METVQKYAVTGEGGKPGVSLLLQVGDTCGPAVWVVVLGTI